MKHDKKQYAGVWLDSEKAMIIAHSSDDQSSYTIQNKIKSNDTHSGGSEHTMNNARQTDSLKYFKSVSNLLLNYDEILVFGPGKSQEQFQHHLKQDPQFKSKQISIDSAEHLTDPQMIAKVRDFFASHQS